MNEMPSLLRHLAAAMLPLASTAAGIVAVGIAVQLSTGPPDRVAVPLVQTPAGPRAPVLSRVLPVQPVAPPTPRKALPVVAPRPAFVATTRTVAATPPVEPVAPSEPVPATKPAPSEEQAAVAAPAQETPPQEVAPVAAAAPRAPAVTVQTLEAKAATSKKLPGKGRDRPSKEPKQPKGPKQPKEVKQPKGRRQSAPGPSAPVLLSVSSTGSPTTVPDDGKGNAPAKGKQKSGDDRDRTKERVSGRHHADVRAPAVPQPAAGTLAAPAAGMPPPASSSPPAAAADAGVQGDGDGGRGPKSDPGHSGDHGKGGGKHGP
jgi:hypothetical protein